MVKKVDVLYHFLVLKYSTIGNEGRTIKNTVWLTILYLILMQFFMSFILDSQFCMMLEYIKETRVWKEP